MSADNGIYIGKFPKEDQVGVLPGACDYEYRVVEGQAIDNIYFFEDETLARKFNDENPRAIVDYFGAADVLTQDAALNLAFSKENDIMASAFPVLEYGISTLIFKKPWSFYKDHAHEIVYSWDKKDKE